jgi:ABC-type multidrug transport system fused ATPase/permease subunit
MAGQYASIGVASVVGVASALVFLSQPLLVRQIITAIQDAATVAPWIALLVLALALTGVLGGVQQYFIRRAAEGVVAHLRTAALAKIVRLPISVFDYVKGGDLSSRVTTDTLLIRTALDQGLLTAGGGIFVVAGALVGMVVIDWVLFVVSFAVVIACAGVIVLLARSIRDTSQQAQDGVGNIASAIQRAVSGIRTIRSANATNFQERAIVREIQRARHLGVRSGRLLSFIGPISSVATQISLLSTLGIGGVRIAAGLLAPEDLVVFLLFLFLMLTPLGQAFTAAGSISQALGAYKRVTDLCSMASEEGLDASGQGSEIDVVVPEARWHLPEPLELTFTDVTFRYNESSGLGPIDGCDSQTITAIDNLSFRVKPGQKVAIVGPSGAGKSTVLKLIERFYVPQSGVIEFDGLRAADMTPAELRSNLAYVEQSSPVLSGTLRDNLALGDPSVTDLQCEEALGVVNLTHFLERLKDGLDSDLGQDGATLSGGERQRLALARAFIRPPRLMLLDETTSNLDGVNEALILQSIRSVSAQSSVIVVAHRLSTVLDADWIVVLDAGRKVAEGTHESLLATDTLYVRLVASQLMA